MVESLLNFYRYFMLKTEFPNEISSNISCLYAAKPLVLFSFVTVNTKTANIPLESAEAEEANHESDG